jgi:hypothetical protein
MRFLSLNKQLGHRWPALIMAIIMANAMEAYSLTSFGYVSSSQPPPSYVSATCSFTATGGNVCLRVQSSDAATCEPIPAGCTAILGYIYLSHSNFSVGNCECSGGYVEKEGFGGSISVSGSASCGHNNSGCKGGHGSYYCTANYSLNCDGEIIPKLPSCSDFVSVNALQCEGGKGLWSLGGSVANYFGSFLPDPETGWSTSITTGAVILSAAYHYAESPNYTPNGSECSIEDGHWYYEHIVCPLGLAKNEEPPDPPEDPSFPDPPSDAPLCEQNPDHPWCSSLEQHCQLFPGSISCCHLTNTCPESPPDPEWCQQIPTPPGCENSGGGDNGGDNPGDNVGSSSSYVSWCDRAENKNTEYCLSNNSAGSGGGTGGGTSANSGGDNGVAPGGVNPGADGGDSTGGIACKDIANCNWATIGNQLEQMQIDRESRDSLKSIVNALKAGHKLSQDQIEQLRAMKTSLDELNVDLNTGFSGVIESIANGFSNLGNQLASLFDGLGGGNNTSSGSQYPHLCDNPSNQHLVDCGGNGTNPGGGNSAGSGNSASSGNDCDGYEFECSGEKNILQGISDKLGDIHVALTGEGDGDYSEFTVNPDTSGMSGKANSLIAGGGRTAPIYTDTEIGALIPIPKSGQCPVITHDVKFGGKSTQVKFDFNNLVPGSPVNLAIFLKTVMLLIVYFANVFTMVAIFRSGGTK